MIISHSFLLRVKKVSDKSCRGNQNTHFMFNNFLSEIRAIYEIMRKNSALLNRLQMTMWPMPLVEEFQVS